MVRRMAIVFVVLCLGVPALAGAQVSAGVKGGLAISKATGEEDSAAGWLTAWSAGGFVSVPLAKSVFFQPEVLYTRKGIRFDEGGTTAKFHLDYVEIPLLLRYSSSPSRGVGFDLFGGFAPAIRTRARLIMEGESADVSDSLKSWDAGVVVGAGVHGARVSGEVRWTEGLVNVARDESAGTTRNRTISFLAGFRF
jgi:hypothetical protein